MDDIIIEKSLTDFSPESREKYLSLNEKFKSIYNEEPAFFARAPGRVNLIGEHIDYCGYSVLPMAIEHDVVIAASLNEQSEIRLSNYEETYKDYLTNTKDFSIDKNKPQWFDYFLSGYKGVLDKFNLESGKGMNICLYGTVPKSAGLSSSSALVVCAALTTLYANKLILSKTELAETCAASERYVGTQGGGMDQAISCLAESGAAKLIDFNPIKVTNVTLPQGSQFVITNSCVEANKAASNYFNTRVAECKLAAQVLAKLEGIDWRKIRKPLDLQKTLDISLLELIALVKKQLHKEPYSIEEIIKTLETTKEELLNTSLSQNTANVQEFQLHNRALHVFTEAQRVYDFKSACSLSPSEGAFEKLGNLMNQSHESCSNLYECSCEELDNLTEICRKSGAYGSRLTGAGWGGCAVSLIPQNELSEFLQSVQKLYYNRFDEKTFKNAAFATKPSEGICIVKIN